MRNYEGVFIFAPTLEESVREQIMTRLTETIEADGKIVEVDEWGLRKLAYEINDFQEGYYVIVKFESEVHVVKELERICQISDGVIRYMVVKDEQ